MSQSFSEPALHTGEPGPILVLSGPGTGKTHSLALRVKWLVETKGFAPDEITVITFTAEAAINMRHRLSDPEKPDVFMPRDKQPTQISTMHSLGLRIIVNNLEVLGLSDGFKVVHSDTLRRLLFEDAAQLVGFERAKGFETLFRKQRAISITQKDELFRIMQRYNAILRGCDAIDFDDQMIIACELLAGSPTLLSEYQKRARQLLIDEYQDINESQFEFIRLLTGAGASGLFAVGDDDQSIYSFRGGSPDYVRRFTEHFGSGAKVYSVSLCRRCSPEVLKGAIAMVAGFNPERAPKEDPRFVNQTPAPIKFLDCPSQEKEAEIIAAICARVTPSHDVLILVPHLAFGKPIVRALRQQRVSYDCRATVSEEGLATLDILGDWLADPAAAFPLRQLMQFLLAGVEFGVPSGRVRKAEKLAAREKMLAEVASLWDRVIGEESSLYDSLKKGSLEFGLLAKLAKSLDTLLAMYQNPPENFLEVVGRIVRPWSDPGEMFQECSAWIDEVMGRSGAGQGRVRIMSMRMAKGLEADYVFVVGLDKGVFPRHDADGGAIEEASRLLFVSMTRAKTQLFVCHARKRSAAITHLPDSFGLEPSPFIGAIPKEFLEKQYVQSGAVARTAPRRAGRRVGRRVGGR